LNQFHQELRNNETEEQKRWSNIGKKVGKLAQEIYPGGVEVGTSSFENHQEAISYTARLIEEGTEIIYEAGFQFDEVLVFNDILVKGSDGWIIYEVKSSASMKREYILDIAIQYYVVTNAGLPIEDIFLVHINREYVRSGYIDVGALFSFQSVLEPVLAIQDKVKDIVPELKRVLQLDDVPTMDIGKHCHDPADCDFTDHCWEHIPQDAILRHKRWTTTKQFELYESDVLTLDQIPNGYTLSNKQQRQVNCYKSGSTYISHRSIQNFLDDIRYPLHFLDFETYAPTIPLYDNSRPYQKFPFQYSLHIQKSEQSELEHFEFLGSPQRDPREQFVNRLLGDVGEEGSVIVYNKSFEIGVLNSLIELFPEYEEQLQGIIDRVIDLMVPFQKMHYYAPALRGSYSIKEVLPALIPELDYGDLDVSEGTSAMMTFEQLVDETDENVINKKRIDLLEYCKRDTLALVRILEVLRNIKGEGT
jgi:hypothetical protein